MIKIDFEDTYEPIEVDTNGLAYFKPKPEPFVYQRAATNLYRYYMYHLKQ